MALADEWPMVDYRRVVKLAIVKTRHSNQSDRVCFYASRNVFLDVSCVNVVEITRCSHFARKLLTKIISLKSSQIHNTSNGIKLSLNLLHIIAINDNQGLEMCLKNLSTSTICLIWNSWKFFWKILKFLRKKWVL